MSRLLIIAAAGLGLAACGPKKPPTPAEAAALRPADARLAQLYDASCKACHAQADTGAPLVHDHAAWDPRWRQGEPVLLDHVVQGYQAMPALGQCASCAPDDLKRLIRFLADREGDGR
ncbi:cytochrome c5 family protein [Caulobacter sp. CCUG 60055]|uniref:c-type cytochrome n=1 Tax=Caulobacter sp. CCUG 60055 TaxID=2100090 RepID=UPI001FA77342|nr:cytochrome c5 family protein [Caulobacteraceae bacterium]MCI3179191.1 cytochrome c5 family protein [Caulobacter sp. CCUG 60055]